MPYSQVTLAQLTTQISTLLDDPGARYWTVPEIELAIWEGLLCWGALTSYWRARGTFPITPADTSPWYDLSVKLPALRTRSWTLDQMTRDIQYMCLEAANGISGAGMSGQISVASILQAIQRARNRFVLDTHLPLSINSVPVSPPPPEGQIEFSQTSVFVHRASWKDQPSGVWTNLWREDAWAADKGSPLWTIEPGAPVQYSEAENAPLKLQIVPPPSNAGVVESLTVDSLTIDITDPAATFGIPDEWVHAVKYAALSDLFNSESQNTDPLRAQYAEQRYQQAVSFAKDARSILRLMVNNIPVPIDSLNALDAGSPYWRNQVGLPAVAGALYDIVAVGPVGQACSASVDVARSAPLPVAAGNFVQLGAEDINNLINYVSHVLTFKCGGNEFKQTFSGYDGFMSEVAGRKGINAAKVRYLRPLFGVAQKEWEERPDQVGAH